MTNDEIRHEFLTECDNALSFLVKEHGFAGPETDEAHHDTVSVSFYKREVAIECSLDVRDEGISFRVARLIDGKKATVWRTHGRGQPVVKEYLTELLIRRGVRDMAFEPLSNSSGLSKRQGYFRRHLLGEARLLRKYGQDILEGSAVVFDQAYPNGALDGDMF